MKATPEAASVAARLTEVALLYQPPWQAAPPQLIVLFGGAVSI
jgi:hypothetical protein